MSGGMLVARKKEWPKAVEGTLLAIGAGFLLALAFLELIPESIALTDRNDFALLAMLIGFSTFIFSSMFLLGTCTLARKLTTRLRWHPTPCSAPLAGWRCMLFSMACRFVRLRRFEIQIGIFVFAAVLLHKVPEGLTVASVMRAGRKTTASRARLANWLLPAATLAGALFVLMFISINAQADRISFCIQCGERRICRRGRSDPGNQSRSDHDLSFLRGRSGRNFSVSWNASVLDRSAFFEQVCRSMKHFLHNGLLFLDCIHHLRPMGWMPP